MTPGSLPPLELWGRTEDGGFSEAQEGLVALGLRNQWGLASERNKGRGASSPEGRVQPTLRPTQSVSPGPVQS